MVLRRRGFIKYILLIPTIWLGTLILFSLRSDSSPPLRSNEEIRIENVQENSSSSFVERIMGAFGPKSQIDADHPKEEVVKAKEQAREMNAIIQVPAPENKNGQNDPKIGGLGEMGNPVRIDKDHLSKDERKKFDDGWKNNAFNEYASDLISLHRTLPDIRDPE